MQKIKIVLAKAVMVLMMLSGIVLAWVPANGIPAGNSNLMKFISVIGGVYFSIRIWNLQIDFEK